MNLLHKLAHGLCHAFKKKGFGLLLAAVAVGGGDQLFGLGHS